MHANLRKTRVRVPSLHSPLRRDWCSRVEKRCAGQSNRGRPVAAVGCRRLHCIACYFAVPPVIPCLLNPVLGKTAGRARLACPCGDGAPPAAFGQGRWATWRPAAALTSTRRATTCSLLALKRRAFALRCALRAAYSQTLCSFEKRARVHWLKRRALPACPGADALVQHGVQRAVFGKLRGAQPERVQFAVEPAPPQGAAPGTPYRKPPSHRHRFKVSERHYSLSSSSYHTISCHVIMGRMKGGFSGRDGPAKSRDRAILVTWADPVGCA